MGRRKTSLFLINVQRKFINKVAEHSSLNHFSCSIHLFHSPNTEEWFRLPRTDRGFVKSSNIMIIKSFWQGNFISRWGNLYRHFQYIIKFLDVYFMDFLHRNHKYWTIGNLSPINEAARFSTTFCTQFYGPRRKQKGICSIYAHTTAFLFLLLFCLSVWEEGKLIL